MHEHSVGRSRPLRLGRVRRRPAQYNYEFSGVDCATGKKTFTSLAAMCTSLQSDSFNDSCALAARQTFFASNCTGTFQESPLTPSSGTKDRRRHAGDALDDGVGEAQSFPGELRLPEDVRSSS